MTPRPAGNSWCLVDVLGTPRHAGQKFVIPFFMFPCSVQYRVQFGSSCYTVDSNLICFYIHSQIRSNFLDFDVICQFLDGSWIICKRLMYVLDWVMDACYSVMDCIPLPVELFDGDKIALHAFILHVNNIV